MEAKKAADLISANLTNLYGYAFAKLYDKSEADDLTSEIVCEILRSSKNLSDEKAFWGFAWKIAENTFRKFIRKKEMLSKIGELPDENEIGVYFSSPEEEMIEKETENEELYRLRRELSLLTKTHREVTVSYYIHGKTCSEIAKEQNISLEMVKYHLFKTRKLLKEGIGMTRKYGEKSYNPGVFRIDFWGDWNHYDSLFKRKLPGSILLAAYSTAMTEEALSMELGVSAPYLEDELEILETAGVLKKQGEKYQTNIVIMTDAYGKEFAKRTAHLYAPVAKEIFEMTKEKLPEIRALSFHGNDYDDNRLLWGLLNIVMVRGYIEAKGRSPLGKMKALGLGGHGWVFGHDNAYSNVRFRGVAMETWNKERTAWFSAENYKVIESCQHWKHYRFQDRVRATCDAILEKQADTENTTVPELIEGGIISCREDILSANFPVFTAETYEKLCEILMPVTEKVSDLMIDISARAAKLLAEHSPESVRDQCGDIAKIHHRLDVAALLLESLVGTGELTIPKTKTPLAIFGVKKA